MIKRVIFQTVEELLPIDHTPLIDNYPPDISLGDNNNKFFVYKIEDNVISLFKSFLKISCKNKSVRIFTGNSEYFILIESLDEKDYLDLFLSVREHRQNNVVDHIYNSKICNFITDKDSDLTDTVEEILDCIRGMDKKILLGSFNE